MRIFLIGLGLLCLPFFLIILLAVFLAIADGDSSAWPNDEYDDFHQNS